MKMNRTELRDLAWRSLWTFVQSAAGGLTVGAALDVDVLTSAAIAGAAAVFSLLKSVAGQQLAKDAVAMTGPRV